MDVILGIDLLELIQLIACKMEIGTLSLQDVLVSFMLSATLLFTVVVFSYIHIFAWAMGYDLN